VRVAVVVVSGGGEMVVGTSLAHEWVLAESPEVYVHGDLRFVITC